MMKIDFYVGQTWERVRPEMLTEGGCGGSEVALIKMAEELAKLGHTVKVWGPHTGEYTYDSNTVRYLDFHSYGSREEHADVTVMWRNVAPVSQNRIHGLVVLWLHDLGLPTLPPEVALRIDLVFCVSEFHANSILSNNRLLTDKMVVTSNGIDLSLYADSFKRLKDRNAFIYSSSPRRGLGKLLREWPEVRKVFPNATLHVAYGFELSIQMCKTVGNTREAAIYESMLAAIKKGIPGVVYHGRLTQPELAELQKNCFAWLYPDNDFEETFCITAIEAQAARLQICSRRNGALPEVLNVFVPWKPNMSTVRAVRELRTYAQDGLDENYEHACTFSWTAVAESWQDVFISECERVPD